MAESDPEDRRSAVASEGALEALRALHASVDRRVVPLAARHADRLQCRRGCHGCCADDLTVFDVEAERIRRAHPRLLRAGRAHLPGACAFLGDSGECRIYDDRPYVCRTQGLPLRWLEEDASGEIREQRDICELNAEGPALGGLEEADCWWIGPVELELGGLQEQFASDGEARRVALRSLFAARDLQVL